MVISGLGSQSQTTCPPGYYPKVYTSGTGGATVQCAPKNEEDIWCSWFGFNCQGPPALPVPQAPRTQEQMTVPGAWTPEMSAPDLESWKADYRAYMASNPGQAWVTTTANQAAQNVLDFTKTPALWLAVGAAVVIGIIVMAKRV